MIWDKVLSGTLGSEISEPLTYSTIKMYNPKKDAEALNPRVLLPKYLRGLLNQRPDDKVVPKNETVCNLLCEIIAFSGWNPPPAIEMKKYSRKKVSELSDLILQKCNVRVPMNQLPDVGYQIEYFMDLFQYIKGPK